MLKTPTSFVKSSSESPKVLGGYLFKRLQKLQSIRQSTVEPKWQYNYASYRAGRSDLNEVYARGSISSNKRAWRHRVSTGKPFEIVETLVAYFKGATFPTDDWFNCAALQPNLGDHAKLIKELTKVELETAFVRDRYEAMYRNAAIYGVSTVKLCWKEEQDRRLSIEFDELGLPKERWKTIDTSSLSLENIHPYDVWFMGNKCPNSGGLFVRLHPSKQDLYYWSQQGYITITDELLEEYKDEYKDTVEDKHPNDVAKMGVVEYYGPLLYNGHRYWCVHAIFVGDVLVRMADSVYGCGIPYVTTTMFEDKDSIYGMTVLDPASSALHTMAVLLNSRLDNLTIRIDNMWERVDDGLLSSEDVYSEPGKVFNVSQLGNIRPIDLGPPNFVVTYDEGMVQDRAINGICSVGPLIGGGQPRSGERVTAQEISAVRDSGGTRLSAIHTHFEDQFTIPFLRKAFLLLQQYVVNPRVVSLYDYELDTRAFFQVDPEYLSYPYEFRPVGATYVVELQRQLQDVMQLIDVAGRVPEMAKMLDYPKLLTEVLKQMRFPNAKSFIKSPPTSPTSAPTEPLPDMGGELMAQGIKTQLVQDGGASMINNLGVPTEGIPPETLQPIVEGIINDQSNGQSNASQL